MHSRGMASTRCFRTISHIGFFTTESKWSSVLDQNLANELVRLKTYQIEVRPLNCLPSKILEGIREVRNALSLRHTASVGTMQPLSSASDATIDPIQVTAFVNVMK